MYSVLFTLYTVQFTMEKLEMKSMNMTQENIKKIQALFPSVVTEVIKDGKTQLAVDFDALKEELSTVIVEDKKERYQMTWPEKSKAKALAAKQITATLRPCKEESVDFDNTQNLYIEGDNLDVLKLLQETYLGKVKMIYIDPPYNTGNDFVYEDDFSQKADEYAEISGDYDEQGNRLFKNTDSNGRFHTDWLNMIYPRLKVAKDLLSDDGVIFISIDDNEQSNLKKICDELFGGQNFICQFIWETKKAAQGMTTEHMVVVNHEYILVYAKNAQYFKFVGLERDENNGFSNPDNDPRGLWKRQYLQRLGQGLPTRTIIDPKTGNVYSFETPYTQEKLNRWIDEGRIIFPEDPSKYPARKEFLNEYEHKQQLVTDLGLYATKATTEKLYGIFNDVKIFTNPKPDTLIYFLVKQVHGKDFIALDFFSGSSTMAHAIMQLNAEDGGNREFIMVQLPELCDEKSEAYKAGYKNICEIGKERIRRAGKKILEDRKNYQNNFFESLANDIEKKGLLEGIEGINAKMNKSPLDVGFRVLKLDSSNMQDVYYNPAAMAQSLLDATIDNIKPDRTPMDLLFQVMLSLGVELSAKIEEKEVSGKKYYVVNGNDIIACFDNDINNEVITEIAKMNPIYAVFRNNCFASDSVGINNEQLFKTYSPSTIVKVI